MKNFGLEKDIDRMYLRGFVNKLKIEKFIYKGKEKKNAEYSIHEFNRKGEIIREEIYTERRNYIKEAILDHSSRVIGWEIYNHGYDQISTVIYKLNKYKQKMEKKVNGNLEEIYKRDKWGNRIEIYYCNTGAKDVYKYHYRLARIQLSILGQFGIRLGKSGRIIHHFKNDKHGNIIERNAFRFETNQLIWNEKSKANKYGDITEQTTLNPLNGKTSKKTFSYMYNTKNNWILKQEFDEQNTLIKEEKRMFE